MPAYEVILNFNTPSTILNDPAIDQKIETLLISGGGSGTLVLSTDPGQMLEARQNGLYGSTALTTAQW